MKKTLFCLVPFLLLLSGCGLQPARDLEQMRVIQVMGIDREEGQLQLSLASAPGKTGERGELLTGTGGSVSGALQRIGRDAGEEDLFCSHVDHILLGEQAARHGLSSILGYICHSPEIRMNLPLFVLQNSSAREAMEGLGKGSRSPAELLQAVESRLEQQGLSHGFTAAEILRNLERSGCSLVCALRFLPAAGEEETGSLSIAGYGVLQDGALTALLDEETAIGAGFLMADGGISELSVRDLKGNTVVLEVEEGSCRLQPVWSSSGTLQSLELQLRVRAAILEVSGKSGPLNDIQYEDHLIAQLEAEVSRRAQKALLLSRELGADFLRLGERLECQVPSGQRAALSDFGQLLPELELRLSVSGRLSHTYDLEEKR